MILAVKNASYAIASIEAWKIQPLSGSTCHKRVPPPTPGNKEYYGIFESGLFFLFDKIFFAKSHSDIWAWKTQAPLIRQGKTQSRQGNTRQDETRHSHYKLRQDKTRETQDKTRQDTLKTRQDKAFIFFKAC